MLLFSVVMDAVFPRARWLSMTSHFMASEPTMSRLMIVYAVGELLRQWRKRRGLSQLDLAIAADVSARHVSLVETGKSTPSADMILRLADQLHVPLRDRNRLLLAAGFAPRYAQRPLDDAALSGPSTRSAGCFGRTSRIRRWSSTAGGTS